MLERKFRGWDNFNGCFHYIDMARLLDGTRPSDFRVAFQEGQITEIEEYTGMHDKTGKEIYEGDIYKNAWGINKVIKYEIKIKNETVGHGVYENHFFAGYDIEGGSILIIGNIHENKELSQ